jgi:hypothetical protein
VKPLTGLQEPYHTATNPFIFLQANLQFTFVCICFLTHLTTHVIKIIYKQFFHNIREKKINIKIIIFFWLEVAKFDSILKTTTFAQCSRYLFPCSNRVVAPRKNAFDSFESESDLIRNSRQFEICNL